MEEITRRVKESWRNLMLKQPPKLSNKDLVNYLRHFQENAEPDISYDTFTKNTVVRDVEVNGFKWIIGEVINALQDK